MAVRLRGRPWVAVLADMIEGVVAANRLASPRSDRLRAELWASCGVEAVSEPVAGTRGNDESESMRRVA